ncbi:Hsp20/alpha crystallin family protein [Rubritalea tangerina]|uniref:Hsp20/alpha crystallin family protein n=1 Tax=Rubritalea tangerina TaxID=430798 RepID=A0ABW4Z6V4_9BACT
MNQLCNNPASGIETKNTVRPHYQTNPNETGVTVTVDLPGVSKEQLAITTEKQRVQLKAKRNDALPEGWKPVRSYSPITAYELQLNVHPDLDPSSIEAHFNLGVLTLHIGRRKESLPRQIEISN